MKYVIWGAGIRGTRLFAHLGEENVIAFVSSYTIITDAEKSDVSGWKPKPPLANAAEGAFLLRVGFRGSAPPAAKKQRQPRSKSGGWNQPPHCQRAGSRGGLRVVLVGY